MQSTTRYEPSLTQAREGVERQSADPKLLERYEALTKGNKVSWTGHHQHVETAWSWWPGRSLFD
jgi:hypothetical protein